MVFIYNTQRPSEQQRPEHPEPVQQTAEPSVSPSPQSATGNMFNSYNI